MVAQRELEEGFFLSATRNEAEHRLTKQMLLEDHQLSVEDITVLLTEFSDSVFQSRELSLTDLFSRLDSDPQSAVDELQNKIASERQRLIR